MSAATSDDDRSDDDRRDAAAVPGPVHGADGPVPPPATSGSAAPDPADPAPVAESPPVPAAAAPPGPDTVPPGPDTVPPGPDTVPPGPDTVPPGPDTVPPGPDTVPPAGAVAPTPPRPRGRALLVALATALAIAALGAPLGLLWSVVAPHVPVVKTEDGGALTEPQPEQFVAADGWFTVLGLAFGVLVAVLAWMLLRRSRGPLGLLAVVVGAVVAAPIAWGLGRQIGLAEFRRLLRSAPVGEVLSRPPDLRAGRFEWVHGFIPTIQGDLLLPAFGAAVAYTLLAGWSRYASLNAEPEGPAVPGPGGVAPVSWDSPAPPAPPAAPAPPAPGAATSTPD